ncbi:MAG: Type-1 restriction enzyme R protein [candidate division TA06 bacterium ADurb.Bin131]|uniref:Type I restriction enzyme endonuclease subunit n=1 Tax=candidate division TA06 bacterium ADurb.Bin131 TaxID=1852827 RepID=A0A1V6C7P4_UNCT6|nr:MAG: Type-1 restriction enzyme R protein [candidate division TA06 bacterium ADurb.Bin131]
MPKLGGERNSVQNPIIGYVSESSAEYTTSDNKKILARLGWEYLSPADALKSRGNETNLVLRDTFKKQILNLNPFITEDIAEELIKKIESLPPSIEGSLQSWEYLSGLRTVFVPGEKREKNVRFIDEDIEKNIFQVTDEFSFTNGIKTNRYDIVFLINGIPFLFVETKAAHKIDGISEALEQVKRYHLETPEAMALFQIYVITHIIRFYYSATWNWSEKNLFNWKTESKAKNFEELVKTFFDRERITKALLHFILFTRQDDELKKVVLRPHQMRAVAKIIERAKDKTKNRGLIWHTQGSGKTYTMITVAKRIIEDPYFENPTVLMIVDRNELESQLFSNLKSVGFEIDESRIARSKRHLRELLQSDTRGLIISMIHKFDDIPANINTKKNIFILVDEAHRTTGGDLGNYLMSALPNAKYIGFTGTPIDKTQYGKGTFKVFGTDDDTGYLDKYSIAESIEDGTTVKLHYTLAPNELRPDRETLEKEFLNLTEAQGINDIEKLNEILDRAVNLKNMLKNKERIKNVSEFVAKYFTEHIEPLGYKAFLVAVDRQACVLYKKELDNLLPAEYSEVLISPAQNDSQEMRAFHYSDDKEKQIRKAFKNPGSNPKILIITEKLLTGFDAPILYCMYLDKPMRDHTLLQAIARVNRPYEDEIRIKKSCGFILDFVGIFDNLEKALAYDVGDIADIQSVVRDIQVLKEEFRDLIQKARDEYLILIKDKSQDKRVESILEFFIEKEKRNDYYRFYREIANIYEILSPDKFLGSYIDDYDTLSRIYRMLKEAYDSISPGDKELAGKTAILVQQHTKTEKIKGTIDVYEINENTLKNLEKSSAPDIEKVFNLLKSIRNNVDKKAESDPYLISIGEKAALISERFEDRQKTTKETLEELKSLIKEINAAKLEQKDMGMDKQSFTIYWILKDNNIEQEKEIATKISVIFNQYPYWKISKEQERPARREIYKILSRYNVENQKQIVEKIFEILRKS